MKFPTSPNFWHPLANLFGAVLFLASLAIFVAVLHFCGDSSQILASWGAGQ